MYQKTTRSIRVTVVPLYLDEQSEPDDNRYVWAYQVSLENRGRETVQLLTRYWHITDANGKVLEVRGDGVVGEQPILHAGEQFEIWDNVSRGDLAVAGRVRNWASIRKGEVRFRERAKPRITFTSDERAKIATAAGSVSKIAPPGVAEGLPSAISPTGGPTYPDGLAGATAL